MKTLKHVVLIVLVLLPSLSFSAPAGFFLTNTKEITEDMVKFHYMSSDGTFELKCAHVFDKPDAHDWDVWCGKGTKWLRQFRVHFLVRQYQGRDAQKSAFEVLYWVIDRDQKTPKFSSTSSWIQFNNPSKLEIMRFSQGVENDYAYLTVELKP
ncbi:hypothetical protein AZI85_00010 [Bdellovibrio bacteriovorus]|uniref:Uncharacterized protein n=1 Tax=Bdellovibrio bacteriovorus TaxID=959 RepID=A0A150WV12_BDEBC|nr:hypothetical protein [Bdellovibrio bacteriovorus]KYG70380.1 hypothetical protein AZI85_00010 [Bdellovibrio bacteriovorus]